MNEENAFLSAIIAHPDEDTPRLAFADWLDEHNQPQRAEFIRAQIRVAQLKFRAPERQELSRRAHDLFEEHAKQLFVNLPKWLQPHWPCDHYKRGFFRDLQISAEKLLKVSQRVWAKHPIQQLYLKDIGGRLKEVLAIPHLTRVNELWLDFDGPRTTTADLRALSTCPRLTGVRELRVFGAGNAVAGAIACCPSLRGLTDLDMHSDIDDNGIDALTANRGENLRALKRLSIRNPRYSSALALTLARTPALAALEELRIGFNVQEGRIGDEGTAALAGAAHFAGLRTLCLDRQDIGPEGARALAASPHLAGLRVLSLTANQQLEPAGVGALVKGRWPELVALDLSWCDLEDAGAEVLARSKRLKRLAALDLERNGIGPKGAIAISQSAGLAGLLALNLNHNNIGSAGARALCEGALQNLRRLYAKPDYGGYPAAVMKALKKRFTDRVFDFVIRSYYTESILEEVEELRAVLPPDHK